MNMFDQTFLEENSGDENKPYDPSKEDYDDDNLEEEMDEPDYDDFDD